MQHCHALLIRRASQQPRFGQHQQAVDEHLAAAVQALGEGIQAPFPFDQRLPCADTQRVEHGTVAGVVALARQQCSGYRVTHGANADLQGAAVAHQAAGVQADAVVLDTDWHVRRGEQAALLGFIQQQVEGIDGQLGVAWHVR
ncbi:hypothetical protein D9M71_574420 [compost metagenome]